MSLFKLNSQTDVESFVPGAEVSSRTYGDLFEAAALNARINENVMANSRIRQQYRSDNQAQLEKVTGAPMSKFVESFDPQMGAEYNSRVVKDSRRYEIEDVMIRALKEKDPEKYGFLMTSDEIEEQLIADKRLARENYIEASAGVPDGWRKTITDLGADLYEGIFDLTNIGASALAAPFTGAKLGASLASRLLVQGSKIAGANLVTEAALQPFIAVQQQEAGFEYDADDYRDRLLMSLLVGYGINAAGVAGKGALNILRGKNVYNDPVMRRSDALDSRSRIASDLYGDEGTNVAMKEKAQLETLAEYDISKYQNIPANRAFEITNSFIEAIKRGEKLTKIVDDLAPQDILAIKTKKIKGLALRNDIEGLQKMVRQALEFERSNPAMTAMMKNMADNLEPTTQRGNLTPEQLKVEANKMGLSVEEAFDINPVTGKRWQNAKEMVEAMSSQAEQQRRLSKFKEISKGLVEKEAPVDPVLGRTIDAKNIDAEIKARQDLSEIIAFCGGRA